MPHPFLSTLFPFILTCPFFLYAASSPTPVPAMPQDMAPAWRAVSLGLFEDALGLFQNQAGEEARLGEALTLLLRQPKTESNVRRAASLLSGLVAKSPGGEVGILARYHLGRIEHIHRSAPDLAAARLHYQALIAAHPDHPWAQRALVKLAIIELYDDVPDGPRRDRFDSFASRAPLLSDPVSRRDLRLLLADTAQRFRYPPEFALEHLLAADADGIARSNERANVWIRIGLLSADAGRPDLARKYLGRFLDTYVRDNRRRMIEQTLAALSPQPAQ